MATPATQVPRSSSPPIIDVPQQVTPDNNFVASLTQGELRAQVEVARSFPRVLSQFINDIRTMALLDEETAASCFYALPRRSGDEDRSIEGPSIRFAEIVMSAWGHMRVEGRVVDELDRFVVSRGTCWDVQKNNIVAYEVRRGIYTSSKGKWPARRYSDDMIAVTANAAASIAIRDAILRNVPQPLWRAIWTEAKRVAVGDGSTLSKRRKEMLDYFQKLGLTPARVLAVVDAQTEADITLDKLAVLRGLATAIKESTTTVDEAFPEIRPGQGPVMMPQRAEGAGPTSPGAEPPPSSATTTPPATAAGTPAPVSDQPPTPITPITGITITDLEPRQKTDGTPYWLVRFSDGRVACTFDVAMRDRLVEAGKTPGTRFTSVTLRESGGWSYIEELVQ